MATKVISLNPAAIKLKLLHMVRPLNQHSTVIMVVAALGILIFAIITAQAIISVQEDPTYEQEQAANRISDKFDTDTINKINSLNASSDGSSIQLPSGRRNPFIN